MLDIRIPFTTLYFVIYDDDDLLPCFFQYEAQNESLLSHLRQAEQRKAELEQVLEGLKEELDRLHSQENVLLSTENGVSELRKSETFLITPNAQGQSSLREERGSHVVESGRDYEVKRLQIEIADKEAEVASISRWDLL